MVGIGGAVAIAAVAVVAAAGIAAGASVAAANSNADAQKYVADKNATATVQAAHEAADAQKVAAEDDMKARTHESDTNFNTDMAYLKQEKWLANKEDDNNSYFKNATAEIDSIDYYYAGQGSWGTGADGTYDYGHDSGGGGGSAGGGGGYDSGPYASKY